MSFLASKPNSKWLQHATDLIIRNYRAKYTSRSKELKDELPFYQHIDCFSEANFIALHETGPGLLTMAYNDLMTKEEIEGEILLLSPDTVGEMLPRDSDSDGCELIQKKPTIK